MKAYSVVRAEDGFVKCYGVYKNFDTAIDKMLQVAKSLDGVLASDEIFGLDGDTGYGVSVQMNAGWKTEVYVLVSDLDENL